MKPGDNIPCLLTIIDISVTVEIIAGFQYNSSRGGNDGEF